MEPIITLLFVFGLLSTNSIDLVFDEDTLIDGFVYTGDKITQLDTWETTKNPNRFIGNTTEGDTFLMIIKDQTVFLKVWADEKIRIIEPLI